MALHIIVVNVRHQKFIDTIKMFNVYNISKLHCSRNSGKLTIYNMYRFRAQQSVIVMVLSKDISSCLKDIVAQKGQICIVSLNVGPQSFYII